MLKFQSKSNPSLLHCTFISCRFLKGKYTKNRSKLILVICHISQFIVMEISLFYVLIKVILLCHLVIYTYRIASQLKLCLSHFHSEAIVSRPETCVQRGWIDSVGPSCSSLEAGRQGLSCLPVVFLFWKGRFHRREDVNTWSMFTFGPKGRTQRAQHSQAFFGLTGLKNPETPVITIFINFSVSFLL